MALLALAGNATQRSVSCCSVDVPVSTSQRFQGVPTSSSLAVWTEIVPAVGACLMRFWSASARLVSGRAIQLAQLRPSCCAAKSGEGEQWGDLLQK